MIFTENFWQQRYSGWPGDAGRNAPAAAAIMKNMSLNYIRLKEFLVIMNLLKFGKLVLIWADLPRICLDLTSQ